MNSFSFQKQYEHLSGKKQLFLYMYELIKQAKIKGKWNGKDYTKGFVLMDSKNDQEFKVVVYDYSKESVAEYVDRLDDIKYHYNVFLDENKMVGKNKKCDSYNCKFAEKCPMKDACWNRGIGRIRI